MSLLKNILFYLLLAIGLLAGVWAYLQLKEIKRPKESALSHLPANCALYLQSKDLKELNNRLNSRSLVVDRFSELPPLDHFLKSLEQLMSLCSEHPELEAQFFENRVHFAFYKDVQAWLLCFNLKELGDERAFLEKFGALDRIEKIKPNLFRFSLGNEKVLLQLEQGTLCCSTSDVLLKKTFDNKLPKLVQDSAFLKGKEELDNNPLFGIYIDQKRWASKNAPLNFDFLGDGGFDFAQMNIDPSSLSLNGIHIPDRSHVLKALLKQKPSGTECLPYLPASVSSFSIYNYTDFALLKQDLEIGKPCAGFWSICKDSALYNIEDAFYSSLQNSLTEFSRHQPGGTYLLALSSNLSSTKEQLQLMSDSSFFSGEQQIYRLRPYELQTPLFFPLSRLNCRYVILHEEALYLAASTDETELLLNALQKTGTDHNAELLTYVRDQFPEESNLLVYFTPSHFPESIAQFIPSAIQNGPENFAGIKHASYSMVSGEKEFQFRVQLQYEDPSEESGKNLLWGTKLDSSCVMTPVTFVNHQNGETELIVQDEGNTLYLLSGKGKILWKRQLNEAITSPIYQVDAFRNKKFQMLFSSRNKIWLIDRLGRDVENFPVKTPEPLTSPLQLFDYENTRDYRLFFACSNKRIYNYTIEGRANPKFAVLKTADIVEQPIHYIKVGESDYLIAIDREGHITAFSRKGELRLRLKNRSLAPAPEFYIDAGKNLQSTKLVYVDEKTTALHKISFSDKKEILKMNLPEGSFCSNFSLVDDNRTMDLVVYGNQQVKALNLNGSVLFETEAPEGIRRIAYFSNENLSLVYGWNAAESTLWLYDQGRDSEQNLNSSAMPLLTELFGNKKIYLVYPEGNQLKCQLY